MSTPTWEEIAKQFVERAENEREAGRKFTEELTGDIYITMSDESVYCLPEWDDYFRNEYEKHPQEFKDICSFEDYMLALAQNF